MRKIPLVPVALVLMGAMIAAHHMATLTNTFWIAMTVASCLTGGGILLWYKKTSSAAVLALMLFIAGLGGWHMRLSDPQYDARHWSHHVDGKAYLNVRLDETPLPRTKSYRVKATVSTINGQPCRGTIQLFLRQDSIAAILQYGDRLLLHAYPDTVRHSLYTTADHYLIISHDNTSLHAHLEKQRVNLLHRILDGPLTPRYAGVVAAMTLGWRGNLDHDLWSAFNDSGILHLLCISGLHVGLLAAIVGGLLFWLGKERRGRITRGIVQVIIVWGFALLSGGAPTTMRAALMFSLFIVANSLGRRTNRLNILAAAAIAMLAINPMLLYDIGWQLSFGAVGGILLIRPLLQSTMWWLSGATVSTAATVATMPIIVANFHRLPLYYLVANIIIVPFAGILLACSLLYVALPCLFTAWPIELLLRLADGLTTWVSGLPMAVVENLNPTPWQIATISTTALLLLLIPLFFKKNSSTVIG